MFDILVRLAILRNKFPPHVHNTVNIMQIYYFLATKVKHYLKKCTNLLFSLAFFHSFTFILPSCERIYKLYEASWPDSPKANTNASRA